MKSVVAKVLVVAALVLMLCGGVALAQTFTGTADVDRINGTDQQDEIYAGGEDDVVNARDAGDIIRGGSGDDDIEADDPYIEDTSRDGGDGVFGGDGSDVIYSYGGVDWIEGGSGDDVIDAEEQSSNPRRDTIYGEEGDDVIFAADDHADEIHCGQAADSGAGDRVYFDAGIDTVSDCEILNPER